LSIGTPFDTPQTQSRKPPVVLTIAGFDPSSGAGITADLQVFAAHDLFGTACITALTVQSTQGVASVEPVSHLIAPTLSHLDADLPPVGIKIGMLATAEAVSAVAEYLASLRGPRIPIVLDPVIRSSSGAWLLNSKGLDILQAKLLPLVDWITPNLDELAVLSGVDVYLNSDVEGALRALNRQHPHLNIVATGGDHIDQGTVDTLLTPAGELYRFEGERIDTTSTHGTGCAFSSALLARLVLGYAPQDAVAAAKIYVTEALRRALGVGKGHGPLSLLWPLTPYNLSSAFGPAKGNG
jgi:hydroxymethylpyrimidine/phosphomethylpyrimidine kinase